MARVTVNIYHGTANEEYSIDNGDDLDPNVVPILLQLITAVLATRKTEIKHLMGKASKLVEIIEEFGPLDD